MKSLRPLGRYMFRAALLAAAVIVLANHPLHAQLVGEHAVYGTVGTGTGLIGSPAYFDATILTPGVDICQQINDALVFAANNNFIAGVTIDARGTRVTTPQGCATDPFNVLTPIPSIILLPSATITILKTWHVPSNTRIIGEGRFTILQACKAVQNTCNNSAFSGSDLIDMGSSTTACTGASVERLKLDGQNQSVNGIVQYCGESSYVSDVNLAGIGTSTSGSIGLNIVGSAAGFAFPMGADGSGPYINLNFPDVSVGMCTTGCPVCVLITAQTMGLHGITCTEQERSTGTVAAIYVNASNNSIEDVHVEAFHDGVQIGSLSSSTGAISNILISNVTASSGANQGFVQNVVHICGGPLTTCASSLNPTDVTLLNISDGGDGSGTDAIQDDVTGTTVGASGGATAHSTVSMYVLGEPSLNQAGAVIATPRFTTVPTGAGPGGGGVPTWAVGTVMPPGGSCVQGNAGTIYSKTNGTGQNSTIYVCVSGLWKPIA
jgi:hypothetical protein